MSCHLFANVSASFAPFDPPFPHVVLFCCYQFYCVIALSFLLATLKPQFIPNCMRVCYIYAYVYVNMFKFAKNYVRIH